MRQLAKALAVAALLVGAATSSQAAFVTYTDEIPLTGTNWNDILTVQQFDPGLGTLTSINFKLYGYVEGDVQFESLDNEPATVTTELSARITLKRPDNSTLVVTTPLHETQDDVTAYDGVLDYGGTSGRSYFNLEADDVDEANSPPPPSDLILFTGLGTIDLPVSAEARSLASGAGNLDARFRTTAGAMVEVTYYYATSQPIPEPSSLALVLVGGGVVALGARLRRRK